MGTYGQGKEKCGTHGSVTTPPYHSFRDNSDRIHVRAIIPCRKTTAHRGQTRRKNEFGSRDLQYQIKICIGMDVMVTENVGTDLDITNGARGTSRRNIEFLFPPKRRVAPRAQ